MLLPREDLKPAKKGKERAINLNLQKSEMINIEYSIIIHATLQSTPVISGIYTLHKVHKVFITHACTYI